VIIVVQVDPALFLVEWNIHSPSQLSEPPPPFSIPRLRHFMIPAMLSFLPVSILVPPPLFLSQNDLLTGSRLTPLRSGLRTVFGPDFTKSSTLSHTQYTSRLSPFGVVSSPALAIPRKLFVLYSSCNLPFQVVLPFPYHSLFTVRQLKVPFGPSVLVVSSSTQFVRLNNFSLRFFFFPCSVCSISLKIVPPTVVCGPLVSWAGTLPPLRALSLYFCLQRFPMSFFFSDLIDCAAGD